ncbi:carboxylesterase [Xanthomonas campestris pv. raphani 756C]|nr:carboxylesterase [Xanthomonas campestris pv. raphani 756C]
MRGGDVLPAPPGLAIAQARQLQVLLLIGSNRTEGHPFAQLLYYANKLNPAKRLRGARKTHVCRAGTGPGAVCAHGGAVAQSRWRAPANLLQIVQIQSHIADPPAPPDAGPAAAYPRADVRLRSSTTRVRHSVYCG